jgi:hypothetical protein
VAVLRDARKSALLRTRLIDDIDMIRTSETRCCERASAATDGAHACLARRCLSIMLMARRAESMAPSCQAPTWLTYSPAK